MSLFEGSWIPIIFCVLFVAYKNLPFVWHVRFLRTLLARLVLKSGSSKPLSPECLFLPAIHRTRSPLTECDYNIHKSNSTYFTDLDISRGNLSLILFSQLLSFCPTSDTAVMILSGVQCVFRKEIKPYQPYEVWSRVMSWDEKWIYIVSHFVERGKFQPREYYFQGVASEATQRGGPSSKNQLCKGNVFASAVSRYVFKQDRRTFPPEAMLVKCGLLPARDGAEEATWRSIEDRRRRDLDAAQLNLGWDAVHEAFDGKIIKALGLYTDFLWR
ncbi:hypothetical protein NUU61_002313 [Penicillium alfredii]|uniref:Thioesterase n=1 Tax=Penicillium alfredii TaxID=1506179 RepID=A0A9W9FRA7_9EURO|nr:uncharacterized protein NUU61_002313 [Penicillium alfredii]KAJ5104966.1 hypothetical protein NUU61_002313 [Penicillium alfredii]